MCDYDYIVKLNIMKKEGRNPPMQKILDISIVRWSQTPFSHSFLHDGLHLTA